MSRLMNTVERRSYRIVEAEGSYLIDDAGNRHLDFHSDTGAVGPGYNHPAMRAAWRRVLDRRHPIHCSNLVNYDLRDEAAELLCSVTGMEKVFFCNSGTEATEACIKLARLYQHKRGERRHEIWSLRKAFHGRTYAAVAASDGPPYHYEGMGPCPGGFFKFDWDNVEAISDDAAAVIVTPVLGAHDVVPYTAEQLRGIRDYCDQRGIVLIFDEIQCGTGRCGQRYLYSQIVGVQPDVLALGKSVAGGYPVGACLARGATADVFTPGVHFSTFGGSPPASELVVEMCSLLTPTYLEDVGVRGEYLRTRVAALPWIERVEGIGFMLAAYGDVDARVLSRACDKRGLILGCWRPGPIRLAPVLDVSVGEMDEAVRLLESAYADLKSGAQCDRDF